MMPGRSTPHGLCLPLPGQLIDAPPETKDAFEGRIRLTDFVRSFALYNLVVENRARAYYDEMKAYLVPGTHSYRNSEEGGRDPENGSQRTVTVTESRATK